MALVDQFISMILNILFLSFMSRLIASKQVPAACLTFARQRKQELIEKGIVQNFMTHLITLCDVGLINPMVLKDSMAIVYSDTNS